MSILQPTIWEIDGYIREMGEVVYPTIIPTLINDIVHMFYDAVCEIHALPL